MHTREDNGSHGKDRCNDEEGDLLELELKDALKIA